MARGNEDRTLQRQGARRGSLTVTQGQPRMPASPSYGPLRESEGRYGHEHRFFHQVNRRASGAVRPVCAGGLGTGHRRCLQNPDAVFRSHIEYHRVAIPRGKEVVLANLTGPGKVTYWYFTDDTNGKLYPAGAQGILGRPAGPEHRCAAGRFLRSHGRPYHRLSIGAIEDRAPLLYVLPAHAVHPPGPVRAGATTATATMRRAWPMASIMRQASSTPAREAGCMECGGEATR